MTRNLVVQREPWPRFAILWIEVSSGAHDVLLLRATGHDVRAEHHVLEDGPGEALGAVGGVKHAGVHLQPSLGVGFHPGLIVHTLTGGGVTYQGGTLRKYLIVLEVDRFTEAQGTIAGAPARLPAARDPRGRHVLVELRPVVVRAVHVPQLQVVQD